jgi:hypothetical protein
MTDQHPSPIEFPPYPRDPDSIRGRAWEAHRVRQERRGICPHSGETFRDCKVSDLCDCFDYPEHEHYRGEV